MLYEVITNGNSIFSEQVSLAEYKHYRIDFRKYQSGLYLVNLIGKNNLKTIKVIKE